MCIVRRYNTTALCTCPVLVHYSIVVNLCRLITRAGVAEPWTEVAEAPAAVSAADPELRRRAMAAEEEAEDLRAQLRR